jgi:hypothetical protein
VNKKGFTLLEVTLFLAVAGFLTVIAFIGLGPRLTNSRFSAAVKDLESSFTSNINGSVSGQNSRPDITGCVLNSNSTIVVEDSSSGDSRAAGSAENCVVNGVIAIFDRPNNRILYRHIISLRKPDLTNPCPLSEGFDNVITCHRSTILEEDAAPQNKIYNYINGLSQAFPANNVGFGYVRDPNGSKIYPFNATASSSFSGSLASSINTYSEASQQLETCFNLGSRLAKMIMSNNSLKPALKINEGCS